MWKSAELFPIKAHYFLYNGAQACYLNYLAVVGKQAGVAASTVGIIFGIAPLVTALMKPSVGYISDRTQNFTTVMITLEMILMVFCWGVFLSPEWSSQVLLNESFETCPSNFSALISDFPNDTQCALLCGSSSHSIDLDFPMANCTEPCGIKCIATKSHLSLVGLVMYTISVIFTSAVAATLYSISDTACYEALGPDRGHLYGRQRLWGTLSWGIISPVIGAIIDATSSGGQDNYTATMIGLTILFAANIALLFTSPPFKTPIQSDDFFLDLRTVFKDINVIIFSVWVLLCGILMGFIWTYSVWFLESMNASKTLTGITFSVQSLLIELPMFFVSGYLIERLGHFGCMTVAFICFGIKLMGYSLLVNPWYAPLVDVVGGAIFPMFYASMTAFANMAAAPGTAASIQCIFGATYEGIGMAIGSFLGGIFIGWYGVRATFQAFGMTALLCALVCSLATRVAPSTKKASGCSRRSTEEEKVSYGSIDAVIP